MKMPEEIRMEVPLQGFEEKVLGLANLNKEDGINRYEIAVYFCGKAHTPGSASKPREARELILKAASKYGKPILRL